LNLVFFEYLLRGRKLAEVVGTAKVPVVLPDILEGNLDLALIKLSYLLVDVFRLRHETLEDREPSLCVHYNTYNNKITG
jgi:hypothetical protein